MALLAFVNAVQGSTASSVTSIATSSITLTAGNLVVVCVRAPGVTSVTDTLGNTYTFQILGTGSNIRIYSCANCLGGTTTITAAFPAASSVGIHAQQFSGAATSSELINTFTTAAVTTGTTIDLTYDTGGFFDTIIVGCADNNVAANFSFAATTTNDSSIGYTEPLADQTSTSFFYRILVGASASEVVRATCGASGSSKRFAIATFKAALTAAIPGRVSQDVIEILSQPVPDTRVTQSVIEVLSTTTPVPGRVSQYVVEVLSGGIITPPTVTETTQFFVILP